MGFALLSSWVRDSGVPFKADTVHYAFLKKKKRSCEISSQIPMPTFSFLSLAFFDFFFFFEERNLEVELQPL